MLGNAKFCYIRVGSEGELLLQTLEGEGARCKFGSEILRHGQFFILSCCNVKGFHYQPSGIF